MTDLEREKGHPDRICSDPVLVTEAEQEAYLKPAFDILFEDVTLWQDPGTAAIEKVIWYQYMDIGIEDPCTRGQNVDGRAYVPFSGMSTGGDTAWLYGLFRSDKVTSKFDVWCAYLAYPLGCEEFFQYHSHLPLVIKQ